MTQVSTKPQLSSHYKLIKQHREFYTGGAIQLSICERYLICWCNTDICIVDINTGNIIQTIESDENDSFITFALHPNNSTLAVATSRSLVIRIYELPVTQYYIDNTSNQLNDELESIQQPNLIHNGFKPHTTYPVLNMSYSPDGAMLCTCSVDRSVRVFSCTQNYSVTHIFKQDGHTCSVNHIWWHPTELLVFSSSDNGELISWSLKSNKSIHLKNHLSQVTSVSFNEHNNIMYSVGRDKVISMWNMNDMTLINTILAYESLECIHTYTNTVIPTVDSNNNTTYVLTAGESGQLQLFNTSTRKSVYTYSLTPPTSPSADDGTNKSHAAHNITYMLYRQQSNQIIVTTSEHNIYIFDTLQTEYKRNKVLIGYNDEILHIVANPVHTQQIYVVTNSSYIRQFHINTFDANILMGHTDTVLACDISADGNWLASVSKDNTLRIWSTHTSSCVAVCDGHTESVGCVKFSHTKNNTLYCYTGSRDCTLKQWDCTQLLSRDILSTELCDIRVSHSIIAHSKEINCIAISPNNALVATGSQDKLIKLYNTTTFELVSELSGHTRGVWCLEFSSIDRVLCSGSSDQLIKLWSITDYTCIKTLQGHTSTVLQCHFINHSTQLCSSDSDGLIKIWAIVNNECIATFDESEGKLWALCVINDSNTPQQSRQLISGGSDSCIRVYSDITAEHDEHELHEATLQIKKQHVLTRLIQEQKYGSAFILALDLNQPRRLYGLLYSLCTAQLMDDTMTQTQIDHIVHTSQLNQLQLIDILSRLDVDKLNQLLQYILDWNTNSRYYSMAQILLKLIFQLYEPHSLLQCTVLRTNINAFISYSQKHYNRLDTMKRKSKLITLLHSTIQPINPYNSMQHPTPQSDIELISDNNNTMDSDTDNELIERIEARHNAKKSTHNSNNTSKHNLTDMNDQVEDTTAIKKKQRRPKRSIQM